MARILLVDDEANLRMLFKIYLGKLGHAIDEASDGTEALRKLAETRYDLVVTDMSMPGDVDGLGVVKDAAARGLRSILCTAYQSEEAREKALSLGATMMLE